MKTKYRKEQQTTSSVPLSILAMSISLAISPPAGQAGTGEWRDPNVTKLQYAERVYGRSHFPGPEKYKKRH